MSGNPFRVIEFEGMTIAVYRSESDGALSIDIETGDLEFGDQHPSSGVPRLRVSINDSVEQLDEAGKWVDSTPYAPLTVLDHIAAETR